MIRLKFSFFTIFTILFLLWSVEIYSQSNDDSNHTIGYIEESLEDFVSDDNNSSSLDFQKENETEDHNDSISFFKKDITPFDSPLREKYNSKEFNYEQNKDNQNYFKNFKEWFEDKIKNIFGVADDITAKRIVNIIEKSFYTFVFLLIIYLIIKIIRNKEGRFAFKKKSKVIEEDYTDITDDIQNENLDKIINKYVSENNFRMAVRYYYIWVLKNLNERNIIQFSSEKTTDDYVNDIKDEHLKNEFSYASYLYTYIWYGNFDIDETEFRQIETKFKSLL